MTIKRVFLAAFTLGFITTLLVGCTRPFIPVPLAAPAITAGPVHYGINDGWHGPLPLDIVQHYCDYGGDLTIRTPQVSADALMQFRQALSTCRALVNLRVLALVENTNVHLASAFAEHPLVDDVWPVQVIENGNELELPPYNLTPQQYANAQASMLQAEGLTGFTGDLIMGGVYALTDGDDGTKHAIDLALPYCRVVRHCMVGVHLYTITPDDVAYLNSLDMDIAITETGAATGCGISKWQEQADYVAALRASALQMRRLKYFILYQRPSGTGCTNNDTFGIQAGLTWKPLDALLKSWGQR